MSPRLYSPVVRALGALIIVIIIGMIFNADGAFYKWGTHRDTLRAVSVFGILACGMTLVIISGGIDLAVGSILALTAVVFSLMSIHWHWSGYLAVLLCLIIGAACGIVSGVFIARCSVQPFIATLAMMVFARGVAKWVSGGQKISTAIQLPNGTYEYVPPPALFQFIDSKVLTGNVSVVTLIFLLCLVVSGIVLHKLRPGRYLYAIGGTSLNGGRGGMWLTLIGVLTIGYLDKILRTN